jgi:hypothetical protein
LVIAKGQLVFRFPMKGHTSIEIRYYEPVRRFQRFMSRDIHRAQILEVLGLADNPPKHPPHSEMAGFGFHGSRPEPPTAPAAFLGYVRLWWGPNVGPPSFTSNFGLWAYGP